MEAPLRQPLRSAGNSQLNETRRMDSRVVEAKRTLYDYDPAADAPLRGDLCSML
jgi:hypothetical protein